MPRHKANAGIYRAGLTGGREGRDTMADSNELAHLERISEKSLYAAGLNPATTRYSFRIAERYLTGSTLLELGPAEGVMTELLAGTGKHLTLVEGSGAFCEDLQRRLDRKSTRLNSSH